MPYSYRSRYRRRSFPRRSSYRFSGRASKSSYFRRRYARRRTGRRAPRGNLAWNRKIYNFKDRYEGNHLTFNGPQFSPIGFELRVNDIPSWTARKNIGEQYKIYKWKIEIIPDACQNNDLEQNGVQGALTYLLSSCRHCLIPDYTDSSTMPNMAGFIENPLAIIKPINRRLKFCIRPRIQKMLYETPATTGYQPGFGWIARDDETVAHYGFKWALDLSDWHPSGNTCEIGFRVRHTVYWGIKNLNAF